MEDTRWTLPELAAEAAAQLARNYSAAENGQVRAIPDERSIRYYTTLGILDRPAALRGRTALYGRRHLAQLVAIKRLQAVGRSLGEIQRLLPTLDDATLSRVSGVALGPRSREGRSGFWRAPPPAAAEAAEAILQSQAPPPSRIARGIPTPAAPAAAGEATGGFLPGWSLSLAPGVTLFLSPARPPTDADTDSIRRAAQGLLAELSRRGLTTA